MDYPHHDYLDRIHQHSGGNHQNPELTSHIKEETKMPYMHLIEDDCLAFDGIEIHIMHTAKSGMTFFVAKNSDEDMIIFSADKEEEM